MLPSSQDLAFFIEMTKTLNISRSSEKIGVTQSALSQSLKRLEINIGVPLFIRTKTGLKLTKAGGKLLKRTNLLLDTWENLKNDVIRDTNVLRGRYTLGMHEAVAMYSLSSFLPQIMTLHPELEFSFVHEPSRILTEKVISFNLDFALVVNPIKHPDLIIKEICVDYFTLWISPHIGSKNKELPLIYTPDLIQAQTIKKGLDKSPFPFKRSILTSSIEVVKKCTLEKVGVGILPTRIARLDLPKGEALKIYDQKAPKFKDKICLVYRYETQNVPAIKTLSQTLRKLLKAL